MPGMKTHLLLALILVSVALAQQTTKSQSSGAAKTASTAAVSGSQAPTRQELLRNKKVVVTSAVLQPGQALPMHKHEHDYIVIRIDDGQVRETVQDQGAMKSGSKKMGRMFGAMHVPGATGDKVQAGDVQYHQAGYTHAEENKGKSAVRSVLVDFVEHAGKEKDPERKSNRYCNADNQKMCVEEKYLSCTDKFCVEEVTMDPGAMSSKHSHATDHMLVALSDYKLTDAAVGKGTKVRTKKAGEVEYIRSGITHQLTNSGTAPARFVVIAFN
jgi:quercetin dioxygenase-like cupin family protein